jgi:hypothetical protein
MGIAAGAVFAAACQQPPAVDPWRDDALPPSTWSTPSADGFLSEGHPPAHRSRDVATQPAPSVSNAVAHYPLWWEDPFEDKGDGNNTFAWTLADYVDMPYALGRFLLNTMGWPVSAVVTPPGTPMVSDGRVGRDHDARPGLYADPTAELSDFRLDQPLSACEARHGRQETP